MTNDEVQMTVPSWLVGLLGATGALILIEFVAIGFYASFGGLIIAAALAIWAGTAAAAAVDPRRWARNASVVAFFIIVLFALYFILLPSLAGPSDPRGPSSHGGPGVYPPQ
jgi:hypothetical protein